MSIANAGGETYGRGMKSPRLLSLVEVSRNVETKEAEDLRLEICHKGLDIARRKIEPARLEGIRDVAQVASMQNA